MKAILMSVNVKRCKLIASGRQTVDIRKTLPPKIDLPFKVYIYESQGRLRRKAKIAFTAYEYDGRGAVVGEFVCKAIYNTNAPGAFAILARRACMTTRELSEYLDGQPGCAFQISELKMYDETKPLEAFGMNHPPHGWCYVEESKEE